MDDKLYYDMDGLSCLDNIVDGSNCIADKWRMLSANSTVIAPVCMIIGEIGLTQTTRYLVALEIKV